MMRLFISDSQQHSAPALKWLFANYSGNILQYDVLRLCERASDITHGRMFCFSSPLPRQSFV